jgi:hypothetical protein
MREPPVDLEAVAQGLKADGYRGGVVARRLITEHGMEEDAACALVARLYGHEVDPRGGETVSGVLQGLAVWALGVALLIIYVWTNSIDLLLLDIVDNVTGSGFDYGGGALALVGAGFARVVIALVNHGVREDLRRK